MLALLALGRTNRQVGQELFISEKTASVHVSNIIAKLGASGRTEAVAIARRSAASCRRSEGRRSSRGRLRQRSRAARRRNVVPLASPQATSARVSRVRAPAIGDGSAPESGRGERVPADGVGLTAN